MRWSPLFKPMNIHHLDKKLSVCGITLVARDDVSDVFMLRVGQTIGEMFSIHEETDTLKQQKLLKNLYTYQQ